MEQEPASPRGPTTDEDAARQATGEEQSPGAPWTGLENGAAPAVRGEDAGVSAPATPAPSHAVEEAAPPVAAAEPPPVAEALPVEAAPPPAPAFNVPAPVPVLPEATPAPEPVPEAGARTGAAVPADVPAPEAEPRPAWMPPAVPAEAAPGEGWPGREAVPNSAPSVHSTWTGMASTAPPAPEHWEAAPTADPGSITIPGGETAGPAGWTGAPAPAEGWPEGTAALSPPGLEGETAGTGAVEGVDTGPTPGEMAAGVAASVAPQAAPGGSNIMLCVVCVWAAGTSFYEAFMLLKQVAHPSLAVFANLGFSGYVLLGLGLLGFGIEALQWGKRRYGLAPLLAVVLPALLTLAGILCLLMSHDPGRRI